MTLFDAWMVVDWSAANEPKTGKDSVWIGLLAGGGVLASNPATREEAFGLIRERLRDLARSGARVLAGFDLPLGYPAGFAQALGLDSGGRPEWRAVWEEIARCVRDGADNRSNRFDVAEEFNRRISGRAFPFWGCPGGRESEWLGAKRPAGYGEGLAEYRMADRAVRGPQPCWKLSYAGCVGSQALLGIPRVLALREDAELSAVTRVWPFETGMEAPPEEVRVVLAEVYPSLVKVSKDAEPCKDAAQVKALARHFARADREGRLQAMFRPCGATRAAAEVEGWILGTGVDDARHRR